MRIVVNDHSGHSFTIQLSRQLALLGHKVLHAYSTSFQSPKGDFTVKADEINLEIMPIANKKNFVKYSIFKRRKQEIEYANILIDKLKWFKPEVILIGNTPLFVQKHVQDFCLKNNIRFIYWCQDIYAIAIEKIARKKIGLLGWPVWQFFYSLEKKLLKRSDAIISITEDFDSIFNQWGINKHKITSIPNWASLGQIPTVEKLNSWSIKHSLQNKFCVIYSGTLGLKHNPAILLNAARFFKERDDIEFIVISEGIGADFLKKQKKELDVNNLHILPFQAFIDLPNILGTADILVAILEEDAGVFSVPSKVLTYLCSQKPIAISVPSNNLSAKIVTENKAGLFSDSNDFEAFNDNIQQLIDNPTLRDELGLNGRKYAEENFKIEKIATKFLQIFEAKN